MGYGRLVFWVCRIYGRDFFVEMGSAMASPCAPGFFGHRTRNNFTNLEQVRMREQSHFHGYMGILCTDI